MTQTSCLRVLTVGFSISDPNMQSAGRQFPSRHKFMGRRSRKETAPGPPVGTDHERRAFPDLAFTGLWRSGRMDDVSLDIARSQPAREPEPLAASLIGDDDTLDVAPQMRCVAQDGYGSNSEELGASICLPLCPRTQTFIDAIGMSQKGQ